MKTYEKVILVLVIAATIIGVTYLITNKPEKMINVPLESSTMTTDVYKDGYMEGCVSDAATYTFCSCSYDSLIKRLGKEGLLKMSLDYLQTEQIPESVLTGIMTDCSSTL